MQLNKFEINLDFKIHLIIKAFLIIKLKLLQSNQMARWCLQSTTTERILTRSPIHTNRNWNNHKGGLIFN